MYNPFFSIIVPAYKETYFFECLDSILSQTYTNYELIIVNDCSPYNIEGIVNQYNDAHIKYYKNDFNYGAARLVDNWNNCLNYVSGDYVICMGDDDKLLPNCLADYVDLINSYPGLNIYHMRAQIINSKSDIINFQEDRPDRESVYSMIWHYWMKNRIQYLGDWLIKTSYLKDNGYFKTPYGWSADHITAFQAATNKGVANAHKFGFQYRISESSISEGNYAFEETESWLIVIDWYKNFFKRKPIDEMDKIYWIYLSNNLNSYINYRIYYLEITADLTKYPSHILHWIKISKEIGVSKRYIIALFHTALRKRGFWI